MKNAGLDLEHEVISLGRKNVKPCKGCWNCTRSKPCPLADDDLTGIKQAMLDCDMLILASPVYTNQVTAQMKAFCDRLFTWCHIYPLLGKYGLSVVTTGNDGHKETAEFLEKMLATYGTYSFGSLLSMGGLTPGFFPWREHSRKKYQKFAQQVANTILLKKRPKRRPIQRKIFRTMKNKISKIHTVNSMVYGVPENQPHPPKLRLRIMRFFFKKMKLTEADIEKWAGLLAFELAWWRDRGWLKAKSLNQLANMPVPDGFQVKERLMGADSASIHNNQTKEATTRNNSLYTVPAPIH
jgi:multimeric flavodoxin WrbA